MLAGVEVGGVDVNGLTDAEMVDILLDRTTVIPRGPDGARITLGAGRGSEARGDKRNEGNHKGDAKNPFFHYVLLIVL